jgi:hypothetical protein
MAADYPWKAQIDKMTHEQRQKLHDQLDRKETWSDDEFNQLLYLKGMNDGKISALEELLGDAPDAALITPYSGPFPNRKDS